MRRALGTVMLIFGLACSDPGTVTPDPVPASVTVALAQSTVDQGTHITATAVVRDADGEVMTSEVEWSSSKPSIATIDQSGKITAVLIGSTVIVAKAGGKSGSAVVFVVPAPVGIQVGISLDTLYRFGTVRAVVMVPDPYGTLDPRFGTQWSSSNPQVATVDGFGWVTLRAAGTTTIRTTYAGSSADLSLTVPPVTEVRFVGNGRGKVGDSTHILVQIMSGSRAIALPVMLSVEDPTAGTVTALGTIIPHRAGVMRVLATVGAVTAIRNIEVYDWTVVTAPGSMRLELPVHEDPWNGWDVLPTLS